MSTYSLAYSWVLDGNLCVYILCYFTVSTCTPALILFLGLSLYLPAAPANTRDRLSHYMCILLASIYPPTPSITLPLVLCLFVYFRMFKKLCVLLRHTEKTHSHAQ